MTIQELRIGNQFSIPALGIINSEVKGVNIITGQVLNHNGIWVDVSVCEPIPLTEEWLLKFGFEKSGDRFYLNYYYMEGGSFKMDEIIISNPKYVHELQNLCHAITGEELTIKQDAAKEAS